MPRRHLEDVLEDEDDFGLLDVEPERTRSNTGNDRLAAGFEAILSFVDQSGRAPTRDTTASVHEKLLAARLESIKADTNAVERLRPLDRHYLLAAEGSATPASPKNIDDVLNDPELDGDDELQHESAAPAPSVEEEEAPQSLDDVLEDEELEAADDLHDLQHVRPWSDREKPDYIAQQKPCEDFEQFKALFDEVAADLETGRRKSREFRKGSEIQTGQFFILRGVVAYVAERSGEFFDKKRNPNARLRVAFANGTESDILLRSFASALYNDPHGRRVSAPADGPIFGGDPTQDDVGTGVIYVVRSRSNNPTVAQHRQYLLKIGVTSGDVHRRLQDAENDPTFLMAPVELVASYRLYNVNRTRLEHLLHAFFGPARADIEIQDRFGRPMRPREWFFVTPDLVQEAVKRLEDGSLRSCRYDPMSARIVEDSH